MKLKRYILSFVFVAVLASGSAAIPTYQSASEGPALIAAVAPASYPAIARTAGAQGEVIVEVQVNAQGDVVSAKAVSGHPLLQKVSQIAAEQWQFAPAKESTKQVTVRLTFGYREVDAGPDPRNEFTIVFLPPYKVEVQSHPRTISN